MWLLHDRRDATRWCLWAIGAEKQETKPVQTEVYARSVETCGKRFLTKSFGRISYSIK